MLLYAKNIGVRCSILLNLSSHLTNVKLHKEKKLIYGHSDPHVLGIGREIRMAFGPYKCPTAQKVPNIAYSYKAKVDQSKYCIMCI